MHSRYLRAVRRNAVPTRTLHLYYNSSLEFSSLQPRSLPYSFLLWHIHAATLVS